MLQEQLKLIFISDLQLL